jgi:thiol-disulfide isomerase/thioredoxin
MKRVLLISGVMIGCVIQAGCTVSNGEPIVCPPTPISDTPRPEAGYPAPALSGVDLTGAKHDLAELRGRVVVVDFWATWCPPCRKMIPHEKELVKRLQGKKFTFIGVSSDENRATLEKFVAQNSIPWPNLLENNLISRNWQVQFLPKLFIIDGKGVIRRVIEGGGQDAILDKAVDMLLAELGE